MNPLWLTIGAFAGYLLLMWTNPVRASLRDGLRILRRYPLLWGILGTFGFGYALYDLGMRYVVVGYLPDDPDVVLKWTFEAPFWSLDPMEIRMAAKDALLFALDSTGGIFNNLVSTFPLSGFAAFVLLVNWRGHQTVLLRALRKRFKGTGWAIYSGILLCAVAAILKPFLTWLMLATQSAMLVQWSSVIAWLAFLFEYIFGVCIQIYLILLAYCWVRGISVKPAKLRDLTIRRFSFVVRFAALVLVASSILIDLPLILGDFGLLPGWPFLEGQNPSKLIEQWSVRARGILAVFLLFFASVQIRLTLHSETLGKVLQDHLSFVRRHGWLLAWFIVTALVHFYFAHLLNGLVARGFGVGSMLWIVWRLIFPWLLGIIGAWLIASWVSLYKRCASGRAGAENWIQF